MALAAVAFLVPMLLLAVPPLDPDFHPGAATCRINGPAAARNVARRQTVRAQAVPSPTDPDVLVIRVDFDDQPMTLDKAETESFFDRVAAFYLENSYGTFTPVFHVSTAVHRVGSIATYGPDCGSDIACRSDELRDAAVAAESLAGTAFSDFEQVMIYHAGNGQETTGAGGDIWSVYLPEAFTAGGEMFAGTTLVPESEAGTVDPLGVICHEYGHQLGLPDLYDTSTPGGSSTVGSWDVMDYPFAAAPGGSLGGSPPHLGAWSKLFLGFLTPSTGSVSGTYALSAAAVSSASLRIPIAVSDLDESEYFLVEYRLRSSTAAFDKSLPGDGILIWHIDETIASDPSRLEANDVNTPSINGRGRRGVDLIEADLTAVYRGTSRGESGDAFGADDVFVPPLSNAFNGLPSGLVATDFAETGGLASFQVHVPVFSTFTVASGVSLSTTVATAAGSLSMTVSPGTFADGTRLFLSPLAANAVGPLGQRSRVSQFQGTSAGFILGAEGGRQPARPIDVQISFENDPALTGLSPDERATLGLARFVSRTGGWTPVQSTLVPPTTVTASLTHLSLFQLMESAPGAGVGGVRIYPNPQRPSLGASYAVTNFSLLPAGTVVRLFTSIGDFVREIRADATGIAVWDGRNASGRRAASGIYLAVIEHDGDRTVRKVAIER